MASLNDFKLVALKSKNFFENAVPSCSFDDTIVGNLSEEQKKRYGFYFYVLRLITGIVDYSILDDCIVDTEYNSTLHQCKNNDEGVDAICFDEENHNIMLFNFKYRKDYNPDKCQSENESLLTSKFLSMIKNGENQVTGKLRDKLSDIIDKNDSDEIWNTIVYFVSNETSPLDVQNSHLKNLEKDYGVECVAITLDQIMEMDSSRPRPISARCILPQESIISFQENAKSSSVSYIIKMPLVDIIRITCNDESLRQQYNIENESILSDAEFDMSCLYDNVRGYILKSAYNTNIFNTLKQEPHRFFFYNNGITIVAKDIKTSDVNSRTKILVTFDNFQVLNGGQTLRTIHRFNKENTLHITEYLSKAQILVRALKVEDEEFKHSISEFTNSQNAISLLDLKATREEQIALEKYLAANDICYIRKVGDIGALKIMSYSIGIMRLGQILFSIAGHPESASNKRREIFGKYYLDLFVNNDNLLSEDTIKYIKRFRQIETLYKSSSFKSYDQKIFYVLYILSKLQNVSNDSDVIERFEQCIKQYCSEKQVSVAESRVLIRRDFKTYLDKWFHFNEPIVLD